MEITHDVLLPLFAPIAAEDFRFQVELNKVGTGRDFFQVIGGPRFEMPSPRIQARLLPWPLAGDDEITRETSQLPAGFDTRDGLAQIAVRPGPGFRTLRRVTTVGDIRMRAKAMLQIRFIQPLPNDFPQELIRTGAPVEYNVTDALLDSLRLMSGGDTHEYKAYSYINGGHVAGTVDRWPLSGELAPHVAQQLTASDGPKIGDVAMLCWASRMLGDKEQGAAVLLLALQQYYMAGVSSDPQSAFLSLMVAFEALFRTETETKSAQRAAERFAVCLAGSEVQYREWRKFMWDDGNPALPPGCCTIRNKIAHGREGYAPPPAVFEKLRDGVRRAILSLLVACWTGVVSRSDYYDSLEAVTLRKEQELGII